jgi:hypothetical protein
LKETFSFLTSFCPFFKRKEKDQKKRKESPKEKKEKVTSNVDGFMLIFGKQIPVKGNLFYKNSRAS